MTTFYWVATLIVLSLLFYFIGTYNLLIRLRNRVREAWSDIEIQLKRRYDLIPNLVEIVKTYATHEKTVFEKVTEARTLAISARNFQEKAKAENALSNTLKTLFAVAENYPDLKANANFLDLQRELADTENKIQSARRFYNSNVLELNTKIEAFPSNIIAKIFKFKKENFFEISEEEKQVKVDFN